MTPPSIYDLLQKMTELQVEVAKINERLEGMPDLRKQADAAEDTANEALATAVAVRDEIRKYRKDRKADLKWMIGIAAPFILALIPIFLRFYGN